MKIVIIIGAGVLLAASTASAQIVLQGKLRYDNDTPVVAARLDFKNTDTTTSDQEGNFRLNLGNETYCLGADDFSVHDNFPNSPPRTAESILWNDVVIDHINGGCLSLDGRREVDLTELTIVVNRPECNFASYPSGCPDGFECRHKIVQQCQKINLDDCPKPPSRCSAKSSAGGKSEGGQFDIPEQSTGCAVGGQPNAWALVLLAMVILRCRRNRSRHRSTRFH